ncbi:MAG: copper resistance protein B [Halieaceae bacterium]|nr:copper resistance protein B [Halieaceae bacterium]
MNRLAPAGLVFALATVVAQAEAGVSSDPQADSDGSHTGQASLWSQAWQYFDAAEMRQARAEVLHHAGGQSYYLAMGDRLELQSSDSGDVFVWDVQGYWGSDINKLFVKTEGESSLDDTSLEDAELQVLWSRAATAFFDVQAGIRYDQEPDALAYAVVGLQGLAPYQFEIDVATFFSQEGDVTARAEVEYDLLLTQRLVLQPRLEANFAAQDIPEVGVGSGLSDLDIGLRLRYEVVREFAPYLGIEWQGSFGDTADYIRTAGSSRFQLAVMVGVRAWF